MDTDLTSNLSPTLVADCTASTLGRYFGASTSFRRKPETLSIVEIKSSMTIILDGKKHEANAGDYLVTEGERSYFLSKEKFKEQFDEVPNFEAWPATITSPDTYKKYFYTTSTSTSTEVPTITTWGMSSGC